MAGHGRMVYVRPVPPPRLDAVPRPAVSRRAAALSLATLLSACAGAPLAPSPPPAAPRPASPSTAAAPAPGGPSSHAPAHPPPAHPPAVQAHQGAGARPAPATPAPAACDGEARATLGRFTAAIRAGRAADAWPLLTARWQGAVTPAQLAADFRGAGPVAAEAADRVAARLEAGAPLEGPGGRCRLATGEGRGARVLREPGGWRVDALE